METTQLDLSNTRMRPFDHQVRGIEALVEKPIFALFDEMGIGKTKQVIDAAQVLYTQGKIHQVIVVCPGSVRSVWYDEDFGELKKHLWNDLPARIVQYHKHIKYWTWNHHETSDESYLRFVITNYEFIRRQERLYGVIDFCDKDTLLVLDESSCIKSPRTKQTKACLELRKFCGRVVLLNGTPISHSPRDMYSQGLVMDPNILECKTFEIFKSRYSVKSGRGRHGKVRWIYMDDLQNRFASFVLRRLKEDCLDLPAKLDPVTLTVPLDDETWQVYRKLKEEFIVWLREKEKDPDTPGVLKAQQAIVKALRLAQLCGGFVGGVERGEQVEIREVGTEKLDLFMDWVDVRFQEDENLKLLVWCRFRSEMNRLYAALQKKYPKIQLGLIQGGQSQEERDRNVALLNPDTAPSGPAIVVGSAQAGGMGLNMAAAHTVVYYSNDHSLKTRLQSEDRTHRPGQLHAVSYFDIIATGPNGQQTMDHVILKALREKRELADMTTSAWLEVLAA